MLALTLLGVLVAADSSGDVTTSIFATGLPERLLQDLVDVPHQAFYRVRVSALTRFLTLFGLLIRQQICCAIYRQN